MTSFSWKKKAGSSVKRSVSTAFEEDTKHDDEQLENVDWLTLVPHKKFVCLEDAISKSSRLKDEGSMLAETERYWEAIKKWDEALLLTPLDEMLYEMKAQALLALCEVFPAVAMAERAVKLKPTWWIGYQTLGRAQLGLGEVGQAIKSFSRAVHINPSDSELWTEDLLWAYSLLKQKEAQTKKISEDNESSKVKVTELIENDVESTETEVNKHVIDKSVSSTSNYNHQKNIETDIKSIPKNYVHMRDT